ncbi:pepsin-2B-like [Planococcus citri]|uniref:pepsin-2B-like n=1 Tax=Planococcus citri TaxID=170843 RepID=UPI0031F72B8B
MKLFGSLVLFISVYQTICVSALPRSPLSSGHFQRVKRQAVLNKIPLESDNRMTYYGNVSIGTSLDGSHQTFKILFDTGTGAFWVLSSKCADPICEQKTHNRYYNYRSITTKIPGIKSIDNEVHVRGEWAAGFWTMDDVFVGDVTLKQILFLEAREVSENYKKEVFDGVMGFGYDPQKASDSFINRLCEFSNDKKVSFYLERNKSPVERHGKGEVALCGEDRAKFEGNPRYIPVDDGWFWRIKVETVLWYGDQNSYVKERRENTKALFVTAEPYIAGPEGLVRTIFADTKSEYDEATGLRKVDCEKIHELSGFTFRIGGIDYPLWAPDFVIEPLDAKKDPKACILGIKILPKNDVSDWVFGSVFIRKYYTIFDAKNKQIGLAKSIQKIIVVP